MTQQMAGMSLNGPPPMSGQYLPPPMNSGAPQMNAGPPKQMPNNNFPPAAPANNNYNNNLPGAPPQMTRPPPTITNGTHSPMGAPPQTNANHNQLPPHMPMGGPPTGMNNDAMGKPPMMVPPMANQSMQQQPRLSLTNNQPPLPMNNQASMAGQPPMNNQPPPMMPPQPGMYQNQAPPAQMQPMSQYPPMSVAPPQQSFQPNVYNQQQPPQMYQQQQQPGGQMPPAAPGLHRPGPTPYNQMPGQQYPGSPQYPQPTPQPQRRLDPDQMPNPIQVMSENQRTNGGVFSTNQAGLVPPLVTTKFVTQDQGQSGPRYIRSTMYNVPVNSDMMKQAAVPFSLIISPLAKIVENEYPAPIVDFGEIGPIRCIRCKAYMCPFMQFIDAGRRFQCLLCKATTEGNFFFFLI